MITDERIVNELQRLADDHGGILQPQVVVDSARNPESPLHDHFEWDETEAARQWRLLQARNLIRVVVKYERLSNGQPLPCRVFVSLTPDRESDGGGYRVTSAVMSDEALRLQLLADARQEMVTFRAKYARLSELVDVFKAMEEADARELTSV